MATKKTTTKKKDYIATIGRRKTAIARVRLFEGKTEIQVNGQPVSKYWPGVHLETLYMEPFRTTNTQAKYTATVKIVGSGVRGQIGAFIHAISRALSQVNPERFRPILRSHGFLTRDPRMKETRKVGTGGRARAKRQSPKR
ncbi:MAG: 30S ribosomal protein S9 [uncultured bacterium]|nr:MAG: 30S ribosomal protein S9 [uncultured bacterium]